MCIYHPWKCQPALPVVDCCSQIGIKICLDAHDLAMLYSNVRIFHSILIMLYNFYIFNQEIVLLFINHIFLFAIELICKKVSTEDQKASTT